MLWSEVLASFEAACRAIGDLVSEVDDWSRPALGAWDVAGLAGHTLRQIDAPARYLGAPAPPGPVLPDAAAYYVSYLAERDADPDVVDADVAGRGEEEGRPLAGQDAARRFTAATEGSLAALAAVNGERLVATPYGSIRIHDYVRTRTMELVVHGLDLARALDVAWQPPDASRRDALHLIADISAALGRGDALLLAATGRESVDPRDVLPVLR